MTANRIEPIGQEAGVAIGVRSAQTCNYFPGQHSIFMEVLDGVSLLVAAVLSAVWIAEPDGISMSR